MVSTGLARLAALAREHPLAAALEFGTLLCCVGLLFATLYAMIVYPPGETTGPWLAIVGLGAAVVLLWTVVVPLYERITASESA